MLLVPRSMPSAYLYHYHRQVVSSYFSLCRCKTLMIIIKLVTSMYKISQVYSGEKIGVKPSSPLQNTLASLVDLDSRSYLRQFTSGDTGKSVSPGKWWWSKGWNPREGVNSLFRVYCYRACWLCLHRQLIHTSFTASRDFVIVRGFIDNLTKYLLSPRSFVYSTPLPCNQSSMNPVSIKCRVARRLS